MALLEIIRLGHPTLRQKAEPVTANELLTDDTQNLIDDMIETMRAANGVGLAATQVNVMKRIFVMEIKSSNPRYPDHEELPATAIINPEIISLSEETHEDWEGCLSIPDLRGMVPRSVSVELHGLDRNGNEIEAEAEGFVARIIQHETDHLNGVVFLDRMNDLQTLTHLDEFEEFWVAEENEENAE